MIPSCKSFNSFMKNPTSAHSARPPNSGNIERSNPTSTQYMDIDHKEIETSDDTTSTHTYDVRTNSHSDSQISFSQPKDSTPALLPSQQPDKIGENAKYDWPVYELAITSPKSFDSQPHFFENEKRWEMEERLYFKAQCDNCKDFLIKSKRKKHTECYEHEFCEKCINSEISLKIDCLKCRSYFKNQPEELNQKINLCRQCKEILSFISDTCTVHNYCRTCIRTAASDYNFMENLVKCEECSDLNKSVIYKEIVNGLHDEKTSESNRSLEKQIKVDDDKKSLILNNRRCIGCGNDFGDNELFKTPRCKDHEYCEKCLEKDHKDNIYCGNCAKYFRALSMQHISAMYNCCLCRDLDELEKFGCWQHSYCKYCIEFLGSNNCKNIIKAIKCDECKIVIRNELLKEEVKEEFPSKTDNITSKKIEKISKDCDSCSKICTKDELFKTSKCSKHDFCKTCISAGCKNERLSCSSCYKYFRRIGLSSSLKYYCYLCDEISIKTSTDCRYHSYCADCYQFCISNDFSNILNVMKCDECKDSLTKLKSNKIIKDLDVLIDKNSSKTESSSRVTNKIDKVLEKSTNSMDLDYSFKCDGCFNDIHCKPSRAPKCIKHQYCDKCINETSKFDTYCYSCNVYSKALIRRTQVYYDCSLCTTFPTNTKIKCKIHKYCNECFQFLIKNDYSHITIVNNCEECSVSLKSILNGKSHISNPIANPESEPYWGISSFTNWNTSSSNAKERCDSCYSTHFEKFFKTPRCLEHKYCEKCVKSKDSHSYNCEMCNMYFESISRKYDSNIMACNLCKMCPNNTKIRCKTHSYCTKCYEFLISNDYSHIVNVMNCPECKDSLSSNPAPEEPQKNLVSKPILNISLDPPIHNQALENQKNNFIQTQNPPVSTSNADSINKNIYPHNQHLIPSEANKSYIENKSNQVNPEIFNKPSSQRKARNSVTAIDPHNNPTQPIIPRPDLEIAPIQSQIPLLCSICSSNWYVKSFICSHNICVKCLVLYCCYEINLFVYQYKENKDQEKFLRFSYHCPVQNCHRPISVPTVLVIRYLRMFLNDPSHSEAFRQYSSLATDGNIGVWIPFFDGV